MLVVLREWFLGVGYWHWVPLVHDDSEYAYVGLGGGICRLTIIIGKRGEKHRLGGTYASMKTDSKLDFYSQIPSFPIHTTNF
jgi:hypothetical protein